MATAYRKSGSALELINASDITNENIVTKIGTNIGFNSVAGTKDILTNTGATVGWRTTRTNKYEADEFENLAFNTTLGNTTLINAVETQVAEKTGIINMTRYSTNTTGTMTMVSGRITSKLTQGYYYFRCKRKWTTIGDSRFQVYGSNPDGTAQQAATLSLAATGEGFLSTIVQIPASPDANFYNFRCFNSNPTAGDYVGDFMIVRLGLTIPPYMNSRWCDKHIPDKLNSYEAMPKISVDYMFETSSATTTQNITFDKRLISENTYALGFLNACRMGNWERSENDRLMLSDITHIDSENVRLRFERAGSSGNNYVNVGSLRHVLNKYHPRIPSGSINPFSSLRVVAAKGSNSSAGNMVTRTVNFTLAANERVVSVGGNVIGNHGDYQNDRSYIINDFNVSSSSASISYKPRWTGSGGFNQRWLVWVVIATINTDVVSDVIIEKTSQTLVTTSSNDFTRETLVSSPTTLSAISNQQHLMSGIVAGNASGDGSWENDRVKSIVDLTGTNVSSSVQFKEFANTSTTCDIFLGGTAIKYIFKDNKIMPVYDL